MKKIKNIIFDLGGVIINLDVSKTIDAFKKIGITNIVNSTGHHYQYDFFYDFERGKISEDTFLTALSNLSNKSPSHIEIKQAWNKMLLGMPKERIDFIKDLKKEYAIFLLSNTNSIHQEAFLAGFKNDFGYSFLDLFDKAYFSHEIEERKPDLESFNYVLRDSGLLAEESLFVDDSLDNTIAAKKIGIEAVHIEEYNTLSVVNCFLDL